MSTGGIFQIIANDGRQDKLLMASDYLKNRLDRIKAIRMEDPTVRDPTPTINDIERTHIMFMTAHYKPFAAIGYEYNKVNANSGAPQLGSSVQFSIPQFGDFFHDMIVHAVLNQPTLVQNPGVPESDRPGMRWCNYPGERFIERAKFEVNGNPLDEYDSTTYNFYRQFSVDPNKEVGYARCMGQEIPKKGFVDQQSWPMSGTLPTDASAHRFTSEVCDGPQTPSGQKTDDLELFIPLLFWFNLDPRLSIPSVAIPYGQRYVNLALAPQKKLVNVVPRGSGTAAAPNGYVDTSTNILRTLELYINNIFVNPEIHDIFIRRIGFNLVRVHRIQNNTVNKNQDEILLQQLKWPTECLFVGMKIAAYNNNSDADIIQSLDKWDKFCGINVSQKQENGFNVLKSYALTGDSITLSTGGLVTGVNTTFATPQSADPDAENELIVGDILVVDGIHYNVASVASNTAAQLSQTAGVAGVTSTSFSVLRSTPRTSEVYRQIRTIDVLSIKAHGVPIYQPFPSGFYSDYLPYHFGGHNVRTPNDIGAHMIPFNLYQGTYQPSGHINISRAREFYLNYTSSVAESNSCVLTVLASAINFLLISDGSAVLRFST